MRTMTKIGAMAAFLAALVAAVGCEDTPLTAGKDYKLILSANPSAVVVDPSNPANTATSRIAAQVLSDTGAPQKGFVVLFSADVPGRLASDGQGVTTGTDGYAYDTLTVTLNDPATINITANASSLTATAKVTKTTLDACAVNPAPTADIFPGGVTLTGAQNSTVSFEARGTGSYDTDPGVIIEYNWSCGDGTIGPTTPNITCNYVVGSTSKTYTVSLVVKDDGLGGPGPSYACQKSSAPKTVSVVVTPGS